MKCRSAMKKNEIPTSMHLEDIMLSGKKKKTKTKERPLRIPLTRGARRRQAVWKGGRRGWGRGGGGAAVGREHGFRVET